MVIVFYIEVYMQSPVSSLVITADIVQRTLGSIHGSLSSLVPSIGLAHLSGHAKKYAEVINC
jgi:hypothetical protein